MKEHKPQIRVLYLDHHKNLIPQKHLFVKLLAEKYDIVFDNKEPDIVFYSSFGWEHIYHKDPLMVFWTGENEYPDFNVCDYAISHLRDDVGGRNYWWAEALYVISEPSPFPENPAKRPFASFLASHSRLPGAKYREEFTRYLMQKYKRVDCPGKVLHNIDVPELESRSGNWHVSKFDYVKKYKFNIAFENSNTEGYITEKLTDCFFCNTVPIYWGSEGNPAPFPKEAMIYANDYPDFDSLIARIKEVDENDELYMAILRANPFHQKEFHDQQRQRTEGLRVFLDKIAQEALNRKNPDGCYVRRSIVDRSSLVDYVAKKEEARILQSISQTTPVDVNTFDKEMDKIQRKQIAIQEEVNNLENTIRSLTRCTYLPYYKRKYTKVRILSHLLPKYRGGIFVAEKRKLKKIIDTIERNIDNGIVI